MKIFYFDIETVPTEKALEENGLLDAQIKLDEPELIKKLSLSALSAKIICLCYTIEPSLSGAVEVLQGEETDIIKNFWKIVPDCNLFVGHNILDFDMRFIYQRSVIHQIKPSRDIPFTRFRNAPIYDTMQEWSKWGREHASLDSLSKALGIPSPKENLDGSKVYPFYRAGKLPEIVEYCKRDVESVRAVYKRLTFTK
ncbi:MAG TPA: ribonuclease H-like domain-containing protein [Candidatus Binatia bacterium]|jgi:3'-5' exonuclease|nr:ribonuclease H-like domain-containing protein [Candidatus Binatia bacterium]